MEQIYAEQIQLLGSYVFSRPRLFFDESAYHYYLAALTAYEVGERQRLCSFLSEERQRFENAFRHLEELNQLHWHDDRLHSDDDYRTLITVDQLVHPAYQRALESVLKPLLMLPAYISRLNRGKKAEKLELYDISDELKGTDLGHLLEPYDPIVRNGIAHGGVSYLRRQIVYSDKKGNTRTLQASEMVDMFDNLLDVCNGLMAALTVFYLRNDHSEFVRPRSLQFEDLRAATETPYWKVIGWLPSEQAHGSQLLIYVEANTFDSRKALFSTAQTAVLSEKLSPGFDRYFIAISQPEGHSGFCAFNGDVLSKHRKSGDDTSLPGGAIQDTGFIFFPRVKLPKLALKVGTLILAFRLQLPTVMTDIRANLGRPKVEIRRAEIHRNGWRVVVAADAVLEPNDRMSYKRSIRLNAKRVIRKARRQACRSQPAFSLTRFLPLGYARVHIFEKDFRRRRLANFGLGRELIGTVQIQRIARIKAPDIAGATIEVEKGVRFAWNKHWRGNTDGI